MDNVVERFMRLSLGEKIILIAGSLLFIVGFFPWYDVDFVIASETRNAWQSPGAFWSLIAVLIGLAMATVVALRAFTQVEIPENLGGVTWARIHLGGGVVAILFVIIKWINENDFLGFGFYLGFILALALAVAGGLMFYEERQSSTEQG